MSGVNLNPCPLHGDATTIGPTRSSTNSSSGVLVYRQVSTSPTSWWAGEARGSLAVRRGAADRGRAAGARSSASTAGPDWSSPILIQPGSPGSGSEVRGRGTESVPQSVIEGRMSAVGEAEVRHLLAARAPARGRARPPAAVRWPTRPAAHHRHGRAVDLLGRGRDAHAVALEGQSQRGRVLPQDGGAARDGEARLRAHRPLRQADAARPGTRCARRPAVAMRATAPSPRRREHVGTARPPPRARPPRPAHGRSRGPR